MKALILSHSYAPMISPRAFRWSTIAEYWAKQGNEIDVVCSWRPCLPRDELLNGVHVYRVGGSISEVLRSWLKKTETHLDQEPEHLARLTGSMIGRKVARFAKWIHDRTWKRIYWPDYACLWYFPALRKARVLMEEEHRYDVLITVSLPFTAHLIGLALKRRYLCTKWAVDIGDPFTFLEATPTNNHSLYKQLNYVAEKAVFSHADAVSVTTQEAKAKYLALFPEIRTPMYVIPPLLQEPRQREANEGSVFPRDEIVRLVYVGRLYKGIRSPCLLLELFERILGTELHDRVELHFFGSVHDCGECFSPYKDLLNKKVFLHGVVPHETALQTMRNADILVNIGNETPYQLPSKVVEYASTGKPILNVTRRSDDCSTSFFSAYPSALTLSKMALERDSDGVAKVVRFIKCPPQVDMALLKDWLRGFRLDRIAEEYQALIN